MNFDTRVSLLHQVETRPIAGVRGQIKPEEGVPVAEVCAGQINSFVLRHFASGTEQVHVTANVTTLSKVRLERFSWHLSTVHVDGKEVNVVVLRVERVFRIRPVESIVVDAAQDKAFGECAQEEIFVGV